MPLVIGLGSQRSPIRKKHIIAGAAGWEDADTETLELARHRKALAEGREDDYPETWGLLFDAGGDARINGIPFDDEVRHRGKRVGSKPI